MPALTIAVAGEQTHAIRLAERRDIWPIATLLHDAFAASEPTFSSSADLSGFVGSLLFSGASKRSRLRLLTIARLALDIEQRMTPWDWCRHAQLVAEGSDGQLLGFVEVWAEDAEALRNASSATPQPVLFNLAVAEGARRSGVGGDLARGCVEQCQGWGESRLFLKVKGDNEGALRLYEREGFAHLGKRGPPPLPAWQERWKGGVGPLQLWRKDFEASTTAAALATPKPKGPKDFVVSPEQVLAYQDRDALFWYAMLVVRNQPPLPTKDRFVPILLGVFTAGAWWGYWAAQRGQ